MTDRAVSTVLDVSVCLLLVGAAVATLLGAPAAGPDPSAGRAEEVATTLAGSTATVSYAQQEANRTASGTQGATRTAHGTLAGLLADAAVSNETAATGKPFRTAVANATRPTLAGTGWRAQAVATWRPYEGAEVGAGVRVDPSPPGNADVHAATTRVPSGLAPVGREARTAAERDGYRGVASVVAGAIVEVTDDRERSELERAMAADLEATFDSPAAAARATSVGEVAITVRAWSP